MVMSNKQVIRGMSNKEVINAVNRLRKEKENPETYGKYGTSRWVTASEFWRGHHQDLRAELARRKREGQIKKSAGVKKLNRSPFRITGFKW